MFAQLRSPWWHVPLPLLTRETDPAAALWREHLANRERMVRDLREATGARDVPWSSSRRLLGVALTSLTFGLWIVAGVASVAAFALGGPRTRSAIAAYYAAALLLPPVRFRPGWYRYACALEVGRENGWKLLVKGFRDASQVFHENTRTNDAVHFGSSETPRAAPRRRAPLHLAPP